MPQNKLSPNEKKFLVQYLHIFRASILGRRAVKHVSEGLLSQNVSRNINNVLKKFFWGKVHFVTCMPYQVA